MREYIIASFVLCILVINIIFLDHKNFKEESLLYAVDGCAIEPRERRDVAPDKKSHFYNQEKNIPWWERGSQEKKRSCNVHKVVFGGLL